MASKLIQHNATGSVYASNGIHKLGPLTALEQLGLALAGLVETGPPVVMDGPLVNKIRTV
jgi:hypothetical protein